MPKTKVYECCICHKTLEDYKPIRLVKQKWRGREPRYNQYYNMENYDFCNECFKRFNNWINKHNKEDKSNDN